MWGSTVTGKPSPAPPSGPPPRRSSPSSPYQSQRQRELEQLRQRSPSPARGGRGTTPAPPGAAPPGGPPRRNDQRQRELEQLRQRGLAKLLNKHFTTVTQQIASERTAAEVALRDLEHRRLTSKDHLTSAYQMSIWDQQMRELQQKKADCKRKEKETILLYQRYVDRFGKSGFVSVPDATVLPTATSTPPHQKEVVPVLDTPVPDMADTIETGLRQHILKGGDELPSIESMGLEETYESSYDKMERQVKADSLRQLEDRSVDQRSSITSSTIQAAQAAALGMDVLPRLTTPDAASASGTGMAASSAHAQPPRYAATSTGIQPAFSAPDASRPHAFSHDVDSTSLPLTATGRDSYSYGTSPSDTGLPSLSALSSSSSHAHSASVDSSSLPLTATGKDTYSSGGGAPLLPGAKVPSSAGSSAVAHALHSASATSSGAAVDSSGVPLTASDKEAFSSGATPYPMSTLHSTTVSAPTQYGQQHDADGGTASSEQSWQPPPSPISDSSSRKGKDEGYVGLLPSVSASSVHGGLVTPASLLGPSQAILDDSIVPEGELTTVTGGASQSLYSDYVSRDGGGSSAAVGSSRGRGRSDDDDDDDDDGSARSAVSGLTSVPSQIMAEADARLVEFLQTETEAIRQMMSTHDEMDMSRSVSSATTSWSNSEYGSNSTRAAKKAEDMVKKMQQILVDFEQDDDESAAPVQKFETTYPYEMKFTRPRPNEKWFVYYDEQFRREYFHEINSDTVQWEKPVELPANEAGDDADTVVSDYSALGRRRKKAIITHEEVRPESGRGRRRDKSRGMSAVTELSDGQGGSEAQGPASRRDLYRKRRRRARRRRRRIAVAVLVGAFTAGTVYTYRRCQSDPAYASRVQSFVPKPILAGSDLVWSQTKKVTRVVTSVLPNSISKYLPEAMTGLAEQEAMERMAREQEEAARERKAREEMEAKKREAEQKARDLEAKKRKEDAERKAQLERARREAERLEAERLEAERLEAERLQAERMAAAVTSEHVATAVVSKSSGDKVAANDRGRKAVASSKRRPSGEGHELAPFHRPFFCHIPFAHLFNKECNRISDERPLFNLREFVDSMMQ